MMIKCNYPEGSTPLDPSELIQLIPSHISTQEELNAWEEKNILAAQQWALKSLKTKGIVLVPFIKKLHLQMFNNTWKWAGEFRRSEKNIGIDWIQVPIKIRELCDDVNYQLTHQSYPEEEIAIRFHHRLVWIHAFSNGNGRHARLIADLLIMQLDKPRFSWGMHQNLYQANDAREIYINALRLADAGNYSNLLIFAKS